MSMEDVAIMRNIPGMTIYEPVDSAQLKKIFPQILAASGAGIYPAFKKKCREIFDDDQTFTLGKGTMIKEAKM